MCSGVWAGWAGECAGERVSRLERDEVAYVRECGHAGGRECSQ